jgi:Sec-independent protein translocase protein TatA
MIELLIIAALALFLFGDKILPALGKRAGIVGERLRHVDDDVAEGREQSEENHA